VLGYRLMQADAPALAVPVFEQVLAMGQEEPQSFRDLAWRWQRPASRSRRWRRCTRWWCGRGTAASMASP
jgi:hypothetical protein